MTAPSATESETVRRTPMYESHVRLGGRMVPFAGWELPVQYTGIVDEHVAVRTAAGLFDVSHMGELSLTGERAMNVVDHLITGDATKLQDGQALYTCALNEGGTVLDDLIIYRAAADRWLVVCNASNRTKMAEVFRKACVGHCDFSDKSDETALIALQGPKAFEVLAQMGKEASELSTLKSFHFRDAVVGNVRCTVARTGYTGEDGVEIFCPWDQAGQLWDQLIEVGRPIGLRPAGLGARDTLRLESRLSLYGNEIDETTNPFEAGLAWIVKMDKSSFVGKGALEKVQASTPARKLIGFEMTGRGVARHGYPLKNERGEVVGVCTSGGPAPSLNNRSIGLGYLPTALATVGTKFLVDCRGRDVEAVVAKTPFYRRPKPETKS